MGFSSSFLFWVPLAVVAAAQFECGDCLVARNSPGCSVQEVSDCVCSADSFCCISTWSSFCVAEVFSFNCDQFCPTKETGEAPFGDRLSGGWVFTIILGSVLGGYCVLGFLVNWCYLAEAATPFPECFPHYGFWKEVPGWVRDGCRFAAGKIQSV